MFNSRTISSAIINLYATDNILGETKHCIYLFEENFRCRRRRLKGIHSRSDTNRTEAEGYPFTTPDCCTA